jgi:hypothetical protein
VCGVPNGIRHTREHLVRRSLPSRLTFWWRLHEHSPAPALPPTTAISLRKDRKQGKRQLKERFRQHQAALQKFLALWNSWPDGGTFPAMPNGDELAEQYVSLVKQIDGRALVWQLAPTSDSTMSKPSAGFRRVRFLILLQDAIETTVVQRL